jgi:casein kinase II subunit alpha
VDAAAKRALGQGMNTFMRVQGICFLTLRPRYASFICSRCCTPKGNRRLAGFPEAELDPRSVFQNEWLGSPELDGLSQTEANELYFRGPSYVAARDYDAKIPWGTREHYALGRLLGNGAFSAVFEAVHMPPNRTYAVKVLNEIDRFRAVREIDISLRMRFHPSVVTLYDAFQTEDGRVALVLEHVESAVPLEQVMQEMKVENLRRYMFTLLHVLAHASKLGVLHRDLDLRNVLIDGRKTALFVTDWGASTFFSEEGHACDVGADGYRAPELLLDFPFYDYQVDIWSAGVMLLEWLLGSLNVFRFGQDDMELFAIAQVLGSDGFHDLLRSRRIYCPPETVLRIGYLNDSNWLSLRINGRPSVFYSAEAVDLLSRMLKWIPEDRISAADALSHPFFENMNIVDL